MENIVDHMLYMDYPLVLEKKITMILICLIDLTWSAIGEIKSFYKAGIIIAC
jgi:hypothetical protein